MELVDLVGPSRAETFEAWATGAAAITTAVAIFIGGLWVIWRYMLPAPFGPFWETGVNNCSIRLLPSGQYLYTAAIRVTNASRAAYAVRRISLGFYVPGDKVFEDELSGVLPLDECPTLREMAVGETFPPGIARNLYIFAECLHLFDVVFLTAAIDYERPRWFGLAGSHTEVKKVLQFLPVDAESLALYADSGKKETSDQ